MALIQAIMTVPERLSFSAQLTNCNLATCWHIQLSILGLLHLSMSIHLSNSFSCSMKVFLAVFTRMSFQTEIRAMEFSYVIFWSDATLLTLT